jgi:hypothetical protein
MAVERVAPERAGFLCGHGVCPAVDDISPPFRFLRSGGTPWIDRRQSYLQLSEHIAVIVGHGVVSSHEHPSRGVATPIYERPKQRFVLHAIEQ